MNTQIQSALKIALLATALSFGISYALAWTAPATTPPGGNITAPINTSLSIQTKAIGGDICVQKIAGVTKCLSDSQVAPPSGTLSASPSTIQEGGSTTITWGVITGATSCTLYNPAGSTNKVLTTADMASGGSVGPITLVTGQANSIGAFQILTYNLTCTGPGGNTTSPAPVTVLAPYSITVTNGVITDVAVRSGVTKVTFSATGGPGGNGWQWGGPIGGYDGGAGGAGAFIGSSPILVVGGGGAASGGPGGAGGTTATGNGAGAGGGTYGGYPNTSGQPGIVGIGGNGFGAVAPNGIGGTGSANGTDGAYAPIGVYQGGGGGRGLSSGTLTLNGGTGATGGGGGGGWGGGGGSIGSSTYTGGAGGGGGSYFAPGMVPPLGTDAPSGRTWALSYPTIVHLVSGFQGYSSYGNRAVGNTGTITLRW